MNNSAKLNPVATPIAVRNIFQVQGEYAQVSVDSETFKAINGLRPALEYTTTRNAAGQGIRVFNINGVQVMSRYDKENRKTRFIMKHSDAMSCLKTLEQERAEGPVVATTL